MDTVSINYKQQMHFTAQLDTYTLDMDAMPDNGGQDLGMRPKPLILVALAGCTGMDVASLAQKMRVPIENLTIDVSAEKSDNMPIVYTSVEVIYRFEAQNEHTAKIKKIVDMSQERYCGVAAMIRMICPLSYRIEINGTEI